MIVKNEELNLIKCLGSIRNYVDEIVIVDTGSVDNSMEIAKGFGALVIQHPWQNDFSAARNVSLDHASGEWILFLDADEEVIIEDLYRLQILESTDIDGFFLNILNIDGKGGHIKQQVLRLFRNLPEHRFQGAIHEQIIHSIKHHKPTAKFSYLKIRVNHYGYLTEHVDKQNKINRNISILQRECIKEDDNGFLLFNLGNEYMRIGDYSKALKYYNMAEPLTNAEISYAPLLGKKKSQALIQRNCYQEALNELEKYLNIYPDFTDLLYLKASIYYKMSQYQESLKIFNQCLILGEAPACYVSESGVGTHKTEQAIKKISALINKKASTESTGISLCMLVLNEEKNLVKCLNSAKDVVDEIIIVDAGSQDNTMQIAKDFGAKIYQLPWSGNFAKARNYSLQFANCPWILVLDADEMLRFSEHQQLRDAVSGTESTIGFYLKVANYYGHGDDEYVVDAVCRLFRNSKDISFSGKLHEEISQSIIDVYGLQSISPLNVHIDHRGYIQKFEFGNKNQRNTEILKVHLIERPKDAYALYALGTEYYQQGNYINALEQYYNALKLINGKDVMSDLYYKVAVCHLELKEYQQGLEVIKQGQQLFADFTSLWYLQGLIEYKQNQLTQACNTWKTALSMGDPPWYRYTFPHGIGSFLTAVALAGCFEKMELLDQAEGLLEEYLRKGQGVRAVTLPYCRILLKRYHPRECLEKFEKLNYPRCFKESFILTQAFSQLNSSELLQFYLQKSVTFVKSQPNQQEYIQLIGLQLGLIDKYCKHGLKISCQSQVLERVKSKILSLQKGDNKCQK